MPDITITSNLASIIKEERKKANISAKDLSNYLNKSDAYISTLERGNIKKIDEDTFINIFRKIRDCSNEDANKFLSESITNGLTSINYDEKELAKQTWLLKLNYVIREIPIPKIIVDFINESLVELNKTPDDLTEQINKNQYFDKKENFESNKIYLHPDGWSYKFNLDPTIIKSILSKKTTSINYITMLGIIYNIYLLKGEDNKNASNLAKDFLKSNKFYTLVEISTARKQHAKKQEITNPDEYSFELPKYEEDIDNSLESIKKYIYKLRDLKVDTAFRVVKTTEANLKYDAGFMTVIYTIPFANLFKDLNKEEKQIFLNDLSKLIDKTVNNSKKNLTNDDYSF